jgi:flagellar hook-basal body complex protein FliE
MVLPISSIKPLSVGSLGGPASTPGTDSSTGGGFGKLLTDSIGKLNEAQAQADQATQSLATGQATDMASVVMSVEQASLEVQLASQIRTKAVDAYNDIFRMQV